jgi:hypothetical protein
MGETITIRTGAATEVIKVIEQGPQGPQGPAGTGLTTLTTAGDMLYRDASGGQRLPIGTAGQILKVNSGGTAPEWGAPPASGVSSVNGETGAVTITAASIDAAEDNHSHQPAAIFADAAKVTSSSAIFAGIYFRNGDDNGKGLYEDPDSRNYFWWDSDLSKWFLANAADANRFESSSNTLFPWQATGWAPISPQTGTLTVAQANLYEASGASANESLLRTPKSGNATSDQLVLGSDSRLSDSRTPTSHTHTLSAITDAGTAAAVDADQDLNTTSNVTFDAVNVNSELVASSIKITSQIEIEDNNSYLATLSVGQDILSANRNYQLPNASGTLALTTSAPASHTHAAADITSGTLVHERGGLEADVSAYNGLLKISGGATSAVTVTAAGEALLDDADASAQRTTLGAAASGSITTSGLTQATARILGRTTASTGAVEEISIGSGLSLSAGQLSATGGGGEVRSDFVSPYTYTGLADAGTNNSTASWLIRRSEFDADGSFVATLTASSVAWNNRLTASYA